MADSTSAHSPASGALGHLVQCTVCKQTYKTGDREPVVLKCGHTFCLMCMFKLVDRSGIICPSCLLVTSQVDHTATNMGLPVNQTTLGLLSILCRQCYQSAGVCKSVRQDSLLCPSCSDTDLRSFKSDLQTKLDKLRASSQEVTTHGTTYEQALETETSGLLEQVDKNTEALINRLQEHRNLTRQKLETYRTSTRELIQKATSTVAAVLKACPDLSAKRDRLLGEPQLDIPAARDMYRACIQHLAEVDKASKDLQSAHCSIQLGKEKKVFVLDRVLLQEDIEKLNQKKAGAQQHLEKGEETGTVSSEPEASKSPHMKVPIKVPSASPRNRKSQFEGQEPAEKKACVSKDNGHTSPLGTTSTSMIGLGQMGFKGTATDVKVNPQAADQLRQMFNIAKQALSKPDQTRPTTQGPTLENSHPKYGHM